MPIPSDMVGDSIGPLVHHIDERWVMAYAASLGDTEDCYFNTRSQNHIVAHPMFAVCPEWPVIVAGRELAEKWGITRDETRQSVHASHDLIVHRLVKPGDVLSTSLTYTGLEQKKPGAYSTMRIDTIDGDGCPVATTYQGGIYLGVSVSGLETPDPETPAEPILGPMPKTSIHEVSIPIAHGAAHTYTESARIWNPIHTDSKVAHSAGLPGIILHGTATLALGVSAVIKHVAHGEPERVRRIRGRMASMVLMPSTISVQIIDSTPIADNTQMAVRFQVLTEDGQIAISAGLVIIDNVNV